MKKRKKNYWFVAVVLVIILAIFGLFWVLKSGGMTGKAVDNSVHFSGITCNNPILKDSSNDISFGASGDIPVPADYDGDGKADVAVYRPSSGSWYIKFSQGEPSYLASKRKTDAGGNIYYSWGSSEGTAVPADYDGDGKTDITIFYPTDGKWYIIFSQGEPSYLTSKRKTDAGNNVYYAWGATGDNPVPADYDGDGKIDIAIFRPSGGQWYIQFSQAEPSYLIQNAQRKISGNFVYYKWGDADSTPLPADYDGDGKEDIAIFGASTSRWYIIFSQSQPQYLENIKKTDSGGYTYYFPWPNIPGVPAPADYDGDGKADLATLVQPTSGQPSSFRTYLISLEILYSLDGHTTENNPIFMGERRSIPLPADYDGDGKADILDYSIYSSHMEWHLIKSSEGIRKVNTDIKDNAGQVIIAHDGSISRFGNKFYWYGTNYSINSRGLWGQYTSITNDFNVYSSNNLINWTYGGIALSVKNSGWASEGTSHRPYVIFNNKTNKYVMWFFNVRFDHMSPIEDYGLAVATSDSPLGPFVFSNRVYPNKPDGSKISTVGTALFKDDNNKAYLAFDEWLTGIMVQQLRDDYLDVVGNSVVAIPASPDITIFVPMLHRNAELYTNYESPSIIKYNGKYIVAASSHAGWSPTNTHYAVASSPLGVYGKEKIMSEQNTWSSQIAAFVYIKENDAWFWPDTKDIQKSRYLWTPVSFDPATGIATESFCDSWSAINIPSPTCASFTYSDWDLCSSFGTQTRNVLSSSPSGCTGGNPITSQSCNYVPTCTSFTYSDWSACYSSGIQTRTILTSSPNGCSGGSPITSQSCTYVPPCTESDWSSSISPLTCPSTQQQTKTWSKVGSCSGGISHPTTETISCTYQAPTCSYTYSSWGTCTSSGTQTRTFTSSPTGCQGTPIISQGCNYIPTCTDSDWDSSLSPITCPSTAQQTKDWTKIGICIDGVSHSATETIGCILPTCTEFTYSDWSSCSQSEVQTRTIISSGPSGCTGGSPDLTQGCAFIPTCTENNWNFSLNPANCPSSQSQNKSWNQIGTCSGGISHSTSEIISCIYTPNLPVCTSFTYSDWSDCLQSGVRTRQVNSSSPDGCVGGNSVVSETCEYISPVTSGGNSGGGGGGGGTTTATSSTNTASGTGATASSGTEEIIKIENKPVEAGPIKTFFIKLLCRLANLFSNEGYSQCVERYIGK